MTDECRTNSSGNKFRSVVTKHLKNVYESGELPEDATCANFAQVADKRLILPLTSPHPAPLRTDADVSAPADQEFFPNTHHQLSRFPG